MADSRAQAYAEKLNALTRTAEALTPEAEKRIRALLDEANKEILADIARTDPGSYTAARLKALKAQVDRVMEQFGQQASSQVEKIQEQVYQQSAQAIDATVAAGTGTLAVQPVIDRAALQVIQGYTSDLIGGLSRNASAKINAAVQRASLGGMDLAQLTKQIGNARYGSEYTGLFSQVGEQTLNVALNETRRVQSVASFTRIKDLAPMHPKMGKGWRHIPVARVPRISHILANGQIVKPEDPFIVGGEELMYPRDPSGSAENTINCSCLLYPAISNDDLKPSDQERDLLKSYGISVSPVAA
jgi:hypothetical protein